MRFPTRLLSIVSGYIPYITCLIGRTKILTRELKLPKKMDTTLTRNVIESECLSRFGRNSYTWQMDVAEALYTRTGFCGAGRTMLFVMPLLY